MSSLALQTSERLSSAEWVQLKRDSENFEQGYREQQYKLLGRVAALAVRLRLDDQLARAFTADFKRLCPAERIAQKGDLLDTVLIYVIGANTKSRRRLVWKRKRVIEYLSRICAVMPENIPDEVRRRGGIEAVVSEAAAADPIRKRTASSKRRGRGALQIKGGVLKVAQRLVDKLSNVEGDRSIVFYGRCKGGDERVITIDDALIYRKLKWGS
jgi:hypothetical protein